MIATLIAVLEMAQTGPGAGGSDPRIKTVIFSPDRVVTLQAAEGFALVVEFADDERIDNIAVGDSSLWQVSVNKRGDRLVIKPSTGAPTTNMIVTTDLRRYVFVLQIASGDDGAPFIVHFDYPHMMPALAAVPAVATLYAFRGVKALFPVAMSDDGLRTTVRWASNTPLPAVTAVDDQNHEAIVNGRMVDGDYVIEGVSRRYMFRRGKAQAQATRKFAAVSHK